MTTDPAMLCFRDEKMVNESRECRESLSRFRKERNRCRDYTYGRQWNDKIEVDGRQMTEYEYIMREGNVPLKNNLIRRIVRNVLGVFRSRLPKVMNEFYPKETENGRLFEVAEQNSLGELFCRTMEEFLISGMAVHRKRLIREQDRGRIVTEIVSPSSFFFNTDSRDPMGRDLRIAGQVHKVNRDEWCKAFVGTPEEFAEASKVFGQLPGGRINITELWRKEMTPRYVVHDREQGMIRKISEDERRKKPAKGMREKWILEETWRYYFFTDDGRILKEGDSPYLHGEHPYVMKFYPFTDGEIHSFVGDLIDQQRYTNRLITLYDWVIRSSAKGVLLIPEGAVSPQSYQTIADQWSRFNGVIVYKGGMGIPEPRQVSGNISNLGISDLLEIQLKMLEDVSGVNGILQGNTGRGNVSGALYDSQTTNALYSMSDLLETFNLFIRDNARKDLSLVRQSGDWR